MSDTFGGAAPMRGFVPASPFAALLGVRVAETDDGRAVLELPWRDDLATKSTTTHGGAIATLLDTAEHQLPGPRPTPLTCRRSQVLRRGRSLTHVDMTAVRAAGGQRVWSPTASGEPGYGAASGLVHDSRPAAGLRGRTARGR
jgi:hypothetical protein